MSSKQLTVSDVMRIASERRRDRAARKEAAESLTPTERAWYRKPLRTLVVIATLAIGGHAANAAPHVESKAVAAAKSELATAKAHLKAARAADKAHAKATKRETKRAKLQAALAKLEAEDLGCGPCTDNQDGSCTCPPKGGK